MNINDVVKYYLDFPVTSPFGYRIRDGIRKFHKGVDLSYPGYKDFGMPIYSMINGTVLREGVNDKDVGNWLVIGENGNEVKFFHMKEKAIVEIGQEIHIGDTLGYIGTTGDSTGPHLHLERHENGTPINPIPWLKSLVRKENRMFKDVYDKAWYFKSVQNVVKRGLMVGMDESTFAPKEPVTRAELAVTLDRLYNLITSGFAHIVDKVLPAVVQINANGNIGSGTIIHPDGYILTNQHVVGDNKTVWIVSDELKFNGQDNIEAKVLVTNNKDLALLKIDQSHLPYLTLGEAKQGQEVMAIGSPIGYINSTTQGIVSSEDRILAGVHMVQTDAEINVGNSGGALVNLNGELVGVPTQKFDKYEGMSFCISTSEVKDFLNNQYKKGLYPKGEEN